MSCNNNSFLSTMNMPTYTWDILFVAIICGQILCINSLSVAHEVTDVNCPSVLLEKNKYCNNFVLTFWLHDSGLITVLALLISRLSNQIMVHNIWFIHSEYYNLLCYLNEWKCKKMSEWNYFISHFFSLQLAAFQSLVMLSLFVACFCIWLFSHFAMYSLNTVKIMSIFLCFIHLLLSYSRCFCVQHKLLLS